MLAPAALTSWKMSCAKCAQRILHNSSPIHGAAQPRERRVRAGQAVEHQISSEKVRL